MLGRGKPYFINLNPPSKIKVKYILHFIVFVKKSILLYGFVDALAEWAIIEENDRK